MGQCGCADKPPDRAFRVKGTEIVVAYTIFPGCPDCDYGPGFSVRFFDSPKSKFLEGVPTKTIKPDEFGEEVGRSLFDQEDLRAEAKSIQDRGGEVFEGDIELWFEEFGAELIAGAMRRFAKRNKR
jgi:hypothetical protein